MRSDVAILTGGGDRPYALGLAASLLEEGITFDFIGSDFLESPSLQKNEKLRFLNLRGNMDPDVSLSRKITRILTYYMRLLKYAAISDPKVFHILWNNKLESFDRTILLIYYRLFRKRLVLTVHNVNILKRDGNDGFINRVTLKIQYRLVDHMFVHTEKMKRELQDKFGVPAQKISIIPFGINSTVPNTAMSRIEARRRLGLSDRHKPILFFGNIAPYKGVEYLVEAMSHVVATLPECRLIIAGRPKGAEDYWANIERRISALGLGDKVIQRIGYVPDAEIEVFFKAADVFALPYVEVFQSGVLFLGYNFGLPVIASNVGALREDILDGKTGFVCEAGDPAALSAAIEHFFASDLYNSLDIRRCEIFNFASEHYSWAKVAAMTKNVYRSLA
jgi:glycosyltransferase involved in cell wall biosynthesis